MKYNMSRFVNIKVRAHLQSEVITDGYCPLDAAIYYHFIREKFGVQHRTTPLKSDIAEYSGLDLPILKCNTKHPFWFYACSFAQWSKDAKYSKQMKTRRFDNQNAMKYVDFGKTSGKVEIKKGAYKNYFINEYTISSPFVEWYLVANVEEFEQYLTFVKHIGKKSSGAVAKWEIEPFEHDWSIRGYEDNRPMRTFPTLSNHNAPVYGVRPSYWHPRHKCNVFLPKVAFCV